MPRDSVAMAESRKSNWSIYATPGSSACSGSHLKRKYTNACSMTKNQDKL